MSSMVASVEGRSATVGLIPRVYRRRPALPADVRNARRTPLSADSHGFRACFAAQRFVRRGLMTSRSSRPAPPSSRPNPTLIAIVLVIIGATVALGAERLAAPSAAATPRPTATEAADLSSTDVSL